MFSVAQPPCITVGCPSSFPDFKRFFGISRHTNNGHNFTSSVFPAIAALSSSSRLHQRTIKPRFLITCFAANKPSPSSEIRSTHTHTKDLICLQYICLSIYFYGIVILKLEIRSLLVDVSISATLGCKWNSVMEFVNQCLWNVDSKEFSYRIQWM